MAKPFVHVLVINWNGKEHLEACFDSLLSQSYPHARFLLIDNASTDGSVEFIQSRYGHDPRVGVIECGENLGWSRGNNVGIERALDENADYVFLLNNDTATASNALERVVAFAESHPDAGAVAPKILLFDQPWIINSAGIACSRIAGAWDIGIGRCDGPRWEHETTVLGVCGGAMFLRAEALRAAGLLPVDFEIYLDDLDLCMRIWDAGFSCWYFPGAIVRHKFSATMGQGARARRKYFLNNRNRLYLMMRNFPTAQLPACLLRYAMGEVRAIGRSILDGEFWKVGAHVLAWLAAITSLPRTIAHRRNRSTEPGRFWPHMAERSSFFPGIELPVDGWYGPRTFRGIEIRPISKQAQKAVRAGRLRVRHVNCYPSLGATCVVVKNNDRQLATLSTMDSDTVELTVDAGDVIFESHHIYEAEATGRSVDEGGWIACESID